MPSSKGHTITSLAPTSRRSRRSRPGGLSLNLGPQKSIQKPVQNINQFCDAEKVNEQIKNDCDRILRLDENRNYINVIGEYKINFDDKNIITTLESDFCK